MIVVEIMRLIILWQACCIGAVIALLWMFLAGIARSGRARRIALGVDHLLNETFGGQEDEYISSRCWRNRAQPHYAALVQVINLAFWDRNHCRDSFEAERRGMKC